MIIQANYRSRHSVRDRSVKQRSIVAGFWTTLCTNCGNYIISMSITYQPSSLEGIHSSPTKYTCSILPPYLVAIKGVTAAESGIRTLRLMISTVIEPPTSGLNSKVGYYTSLAIIGTSLMPIRAGLLTTLEVDTSVVPDSFCI